MMATLAFNEIITDITHFTELTLITEISHTAEITVITRNAHSSLIRFIHCPFY